MRRKMNINRNLILGLICAASLLVASGAAQAQTTQYDELAKLPFPGAYPTEGSAKILKDELAFQRGVQTYLWSLPAMNMYAMREGQRKAFDDDSNTLMIAKDRIDYRLEYTTGNPDVIYAFAWLDLKKEGPHGDGYAALIAGAAG